MGIRISRCGYCAKEGTRLRVEGSLGASEAELLERTCAEVQGESPAGIVLDLEGITFLDGESARVIRRLKQEEGVTLAGECLFVQEIIEGTDPA